MAYGELVRIFNERINLEVNELLILAQKPKHINNESV